MLFMVFINPDQLDFYLLYTWEHEHLQIWHALRFSKWQIRHGLSKEFPSNLQNAEINLSRRPLTHACSHLCKSFRLEVNCTWTCSTDFTVQFRRSLYSISLIIQHEIFTAVCNLKFSFSVCAWNVTANKIPSHLLLF